MAVATHSVILAAGRGSRMGELTAAKPKCLTVLAGKSLLAWQLAALRSAGIQAIAVVGGYRKELLTSGSYELLDNPDWATTNMVATMRCASTLLRQFSCLVCYSDILYRPEHIRALAEVDGDIAISYDLQWGSLWSARFADPLTDAETFRQENGWLTTIGERAECLADIEGQYMGLLKFTPAGWGQVERVITALAPETLRRIDVTALLGLLLRAGTPIRCVPVIGGWCEIDGSADLELYGRLLDESERSGNRWDHDWRW